MTRGDPKASATFGECLPPFANSVLNRLQLPPLDREHHLPSFGNVSSWGSAETSSSDFIFNAYGHGWHVDRVRFDALLRARVEQAGVTIVAGTGDELQARWIIDCTGRGAHVARRRGARIEGTDRLVAFAAVVHSHQDHDIDCSTLTEAAPEGWWYSARLTQGRRVVAFHSDGDLPVCQQARRSDGFVELLNRTRHVRARLAGYDIPEHFPVALAAGGRWLEKAFGDGWVAVGDAAQSYDPLSSQGLICALESGIRAGFAVDSALDGDYRHLRRYQTMLELERVRYQRLRAQFYALERRWPESTFWQRRLAGAPLTRVASG